MSLAWELVGEINVSSATTQVDFTGLSFTSDDNLMLVSDIRNGALDTNFYLYVNGLTTTYYNQKLTADSTTVSGAIATTAIMSYCEANDDTQCNAKIKLTESGYFTWQAENIREYDTTTVAIDIYYGTKVATVASITQINVVASNASAIGIGSNFKLYKCIGAVVADITVSTATTQVNITGLNIGKDNEYMLVSDIVNAIGSTSNYSLYVNADTTATNYYEQYLYATATSVTGARANNALYATCETSDSLLSNANIKLTNSGYFTFQSSEVRRYGASDVGLQKFCGTKTATISSITSLAITASMTNAIGIGSRFQLIRME